uniref:Disease resistance N-terminal domain-containing protein n=1 Tax=Lactuca sativa TaxID=4236 RepID=A0A9R1W192_LACSA|nr:hypothetical protein LSAT_V11C300149950 [Lactuca sativa]
MAEILGSAFFAVFFEKLASEALKRVACSKKEISKEAVKEWLNALQHLPYDIDDLLGDLATKAIHRKFSEEYGATINKVRKLIPSCFSSLSSTKMRNKIHNITSKLQELLEERNNLGLCEIGESRKLRNRKLEISLLDPSSIVGRTDDKEALLLKLYEPCDRNFSILPIVGMGGLDKTTLGRLLYD